MYIHRIMSALQNLNEMKSFSRRFAEFTRWKLIILDWITSKYFLVEQKRRRNGWLRIVDGWNAMCKLLVQVSQL